MFADLKPLKDLAENWNIDISSSIEKYLEELGHETSLFDGGETGMNFAEAAILVQSCTCIYSKKVEYIYSLLFEVLDLITKKSKQGLKPSVDEEGNDADAEFKGEEDEYDFLSLDDLPESNNLYMKEDFEEGEKFQLLPWVPLCFLTVEETDNGDDPLLSKTGELLASRKDFKMNSCCIHTSGMLLLDNSQLELLKKFKMETKSTTQVSNDVLGELPESRNDHEASGLQDAPNDDFPCMDEGGDDLNCTDPVNGDHMDVGIDALCGNQRTDKIHTKKSTQKKSPIDPLKLLDINEVVRPPKPFVRGKNLIKLCPGLEVLGRKRKRTKITPPIEPVKNFINRKCFTQRIPQSVAKKCRMIQEFDQQYYKEFKRRKAMEQMWKKKQQEENRLELEGDEEEEDVEEEEEIEEERLGLIESPADGEDILTDYNDERLDDFFDSLDVGQNTCSDLVQRHDDFEDCVVDSYEDMVRRHVEEFMTSAQEHMQVMNLSKRVSEWEDKIIPKLQEEETRNAFEINRYAGNVIDELEDGASITFRRVVQGKPHFEICRTFLVTLMLANTENLKIEEKGSLKEGMDNFELQLLSTKRHFEELQEYQAPSMGSNP